MRIKQLEALATEMVEDGQSPNLFFVSAAGRGILMVTSDFLAAHAFWQSLPRTIETTLEDRQNGVLASTEPIENNSKILHTYDDAERLVH